MSAFHGPPPAFIAIDNEVTANYQNRTKFFIDPGRRSGEHIITSRRNDRKARPAEARF